MCNCFNPSGDDDDITVWSRHITHTENGTSVADSGDAESMRLRAAGSQKITDYDSILDTAHHRLPDRQLFETYNDEDEERDTSYVLAALSESRHSLKLLEGHCSGTEEARTPTSTALSSDRNAAPPTSVRQADAMTLVNRLLCAKLVYRTLRMPVGNVLLDDARQAYSVRGYFLPAMGPGFQFISHVPLRQHWRIDAEVCIIYTVIVLTYFRETCLQSNSLRALEPPVMLLPQEFTRDYRDKLDVLEANDLSVVPSVTAPCLSVLVQDISLYKPEGANTIAMNVNVKTR